MKLIFLRTHKIIKRIFLKFQSTLKNLGISKHMKDEYIKNGMIDHSGIPTDKVNSNIFYFQRKVDRLSFGVLLVQYFKDESHLTITRKKRKEIGSRNNFSQ